MMGPHTEAMTYNIQLEGSVVMNAVGNLPEAFHLTFGLIHALHLEYPKKMRYTFEFVQKVMLNLGGEKLRPKLQTLKNALVE